VYTRNTRATPFTIVS